MPGLFSSPHRLTSCCFCLSLKTGCCIIGSLTTIVCSLELISACHNLTELLDKERHCMDNVYWEERMKRTYFNTCSQIKVVQFMLITDLIIFVIGFNGSALLLYGIKSRQPKLFLAWLAFSGMVIFSNFFSILIWHNMTIMMNIAIVIILSYFFRVVRSYHLMLIEELEIGCPVVAVAFPQESSMQVFLPTPRRGRTPASDSDYSKDDPPPPYPGLPVAGSCHSIESQPPPYSLVSPNYDGPPLPGEPSGPALPLSDGTLVESPVTPGSSGQPRLVRSSASLSRKESEDAPDRTYQQEPSGSCLPLHQDSVYENSINCHPLLPSSEPELRPEPNQQSNGDDSSSNSDRQPHSSQATNVVSGLALITVSSHEDQNCDKDQRETFKDPSSSQRLPDGVDTRGESSRKNYST